MAADRAARTLAKLRDGVEATGAACGLNVVAGGLASVDLSTSTAAADVVFASER